MDLYELDQALEQLRSATDHAGANLFELDRTPARSLLAVAGLDGVSRQRWVEAELALDCLFQSYATLSATVEAAVAERGTGPTLSAARRAKVASLVLSPSVEVPERAVPLAERDLVGGSRIVRRCTPGELLAAMAAPFELARSVILGAAEAWAVGRPQVQELRERLAAVVADGGLDRTADDAAVLERRLAELEHLLVTDPLAYDRAEVDELGERVRALAAAGDAARRARAGFDDDMAAARAELVGLREAAGEAQRTRSEAEVRVLGLGPLPPLPLDALTEELDRIGSLGATGAWGSVAAELADWRQRTAKLRRDLDLALAEQRSGLEQRRRLRGRLDAYTAKASRLGCIEQPQLDELRTDAEAQLFEGPTDLTMAEDALRRYQQALDAFVEERSGSAR